MAHTPGSPYGSRQQPDNDIYTVLVIIACAAAALALGFVIYKSSTLLGVPFPSFS